MAFNLYLTRIKDVFLGWSTSGSLGSWCIMKWTSESILYFGQWEGGGERWEGGWRTIGRKGAYCQLASMPRELMRNMSGHRFHYWYWWTITLHIPYLQCTFYLIVCIWLLNSGSSKHFTIGSVWACKYFNCVTTSVLFSTSSTMKKKILISNTNNKKINVFKTLLNNYFLLKEE